MAEDVNISKSGQWRVFVQDAGSSPTNPYNYVGCLNLGGIQEDLGTGEPIYCPSSEVPGAFDIVDTTAPPPALPTTDFTQHMSRQLQDFWWDLRKRKCEFNMAVKGSNCARPDDPDDFEAKIIVRRAKMTAFNTGAFNGIAEDAAIDLTGTIQLISFDRFLPMTFGEVAENDAFSEVLDGIYADKIQCGNCGSPSDGCQKAYALVTTEAASPASPAAIVYTNDNWSSSDHDFIDTLTTNTANALAQVGQRIVVVSEVDEAHHYKLQSAIDDGTSGSWTRVASGYVATKGPQAIWSKSPSETFVAAEGGYVYFMANPAAAVTVLTDGSVTTQNLFDIRGKNRTIVAVGASNAVIVSYNNGQTWSLVTGPDVGVTLNTVEVINDRIWWVGTASGNLWYTEDSGVSWTEATPDSAITSIPRVRFVDEIVGYLTATLSGSVRVYRTADNGNTWHYDGSYVGGVPTASEYNFITPCPNNYNVAFAGGIAAVGTDGIIILGAG